MGVRCEVFVINWGKGGRSKNPGPLDITLCVLNPTSVLQKTKAILDIQADVYFLSETSATKATQRTIGNRLPRGGDIHWGDPCPPRVPEDCLRGNSMGVALYAKVPVRMSRNPVPSWLMQSCRYMERWLKIGHLDVVAICVYAKVGKSEEARNMNLVLLNQTLQRAQRGGAHVIVAGDFNTSLDNTGLRTQFERYGFVDMLQWARTAHPQAHLPGSQF